MKLNSKDGRLYNSIIEVINQVMDNYDYETVVMLIESDCQDSLLLITKAQALKAMNRYLDVIVINIILMIMKILQL